MHTANLRLLPQLWSSGRAYRSQTLKLTFMAVPHPTLSQAMEFHVSGGCVSDFAKKWANCKYTPQSLSFVPEPPQSM